MKRIALTGLLVGLLAGTAAAQSESVWDQDFLDSPRQNARSFDDFGGSAATTARKPRFSRVGEAFRKLRDRRKNSSSEPGVLLDDVVPTEGDTAFGAVYPQDRTRVEAAGADAARTRDIPNELPIATAAQPDPWAAGDFSEPQPNLRRVFRMPSLHAAPRGRLVSVGRFIPRFHSSHDDLGVGPGVTLQDVVPAEIEAQQGGPAPGELAPAQPSDDFADLAACDRCGKPWTNCRCDGHGWRFFGEYLLLQPRGADQVFAVRAANCDLSANPPTDTEQIDFGFQSGFRVGFEKDIVPGYSVIAANFAHFEANEHERANPIGGVGTGVLVPIVAFDPTTTCNASTSSIARADATVNFDRVNLDYKRYIECGNCRWDWALGFAYGELLQDLKARFDEDRVAVDTGSWGYGTHVGGGLEYGFGCFRGFGHVDLTLLASNVEADYEQRNAFTGRVAHFDQDLDRIIPVLDLELGVAVDVCRNTVIKVGYLYSMWFNVVTTPEFIDAVQALDVDGSVSDTLTFDGLFVRFEYTW